MYDVARYTAVRRKQILVSGVGRHCTWYSTDLGDIENPLFAFETMVLSTSSAEKKQFPVCGDHIFFRCRSTPVDRLSGWFSAAVQLSPTHVQFVFIGCSRCYCCRAVLFLNNFWVSAAIIRWPVDLVAKSPSVIFISFSVSEQRRLHAYRRMHCTSLSGLVADRSAVGGQ